MTPTSSRMDSCLWWYQLHGLLLKGESSFVVDVARSMSERCRLWRWVTLICGDSLPGLPCDGHMKDRCSAVQSVHEIKTLLTFHSQQSSMTHGHSVCSFFVQLKTVESGNEHCIYLKSDGCSGVCVYFEESLHVGLYFSFILMRSILVQTVVSSCCCAVCKSLILRIGRGTPSTVATHVPASKSLGSGRSVKVKQ